MLPVCFIFVLFLTVQTRIGVEVETRQHNNKIFRVRLTVSQSPLFVQQLPSLLPKTNARSNLVCVCLLVCLAELERRAQ